MTDHSTDTPQPPAGPSGKNTRDVAVGIGCAIGAAAFASLVIPAYIAVPESVEAMVLSPAFLPYALTVGIGLLGLVYAVQALFDRGLPREDDEGFVPSAGWLWTALVLLGVFAAFRWLPTVVGTIPVAVAAMAVLVLIGGERSPRRGALVATILPVLVWLFFTQVAQVPLPAGPIEEFLTP